jgi:hypothetical protein
MATLPAADEQEGAIILAAEQEMATQLALYHYKVRQSWHSEWQRNYP